MNLVSTISDRMKEAMKIHNMKQSDLVERTKIGKSSISTYLSGEYKPKQDKIMLIANALNVDVNWLIGYDVPMKKDFPNLTSKDEKDEYYIISN